jgi:hypothetical protein
MGTNRIPKQALQYKPKGRRNIGGLRKRWRMRIKEQETRLILHKYDDDDDDDDDEDDDDEDDNDKSSCVFLQIIQVKEHKIF